MYETGPAIVTKAEPLGLSVPRLFWLVDETVPPPVTSNTAEVSVITTGRRFPNAS